MVKNHREQKSVPGLVLYVVTRKGDRAQAHWGGLFIGCSEYQPSMQRSAEPMDSAVNQAIDQANQTNYVTEWVLIAVFVIAPLMLLFISIPVLIVHQRRLKCPKCGFWRKNRLSGVQTVKNVDGGKTTLSTQRLVICRKCKNEFTV